MEKYGLHVSCLRIARFSCSIQAHIMNSEPISWHKQFDAVSRGCNMVRFQWSTCDRRAWYKLLFIEIFLFYSDSYYQSDTVTCLYYSGGAKYSDQLFSFLL